MTAPDLPVPRRIGPPYSTAIAATLGYALLLASLPYGPPLLLGIMLFALPVVAFVLILLVLWRDVTEYSRKLRGSQERGRPEGARVEVINVTVGPKPRTFAWIVTGWLAAYGLWTVALLSGIDTRWIGAILVPSPVAVAIWLQWRTNRDLKAVARMFASPQPRTLDDEL